MLDCLHSLPFVSEKGSTDMQPTGRIFRDQQSILVPRMGLDLNHCSVARCFCLAFPIVYSIYKQLCKMYSSFVLRYKCFSTNPLLVNLIRVTFL